MMGHLILPAPLPQPFALYDGELAQSTGGAWPGANTIRLVGVTLNVAITLTGLRCAFTSGGAGHYDIGIYTSAGTLLAHSGSTNSGSGVQTYSLATALQLAPGLYWLALWVDNTTDQVVRTSSQNNMAVVQGGTASGGLPSATSGITGLANATYKPILIGLRQGGWS